MSDVAEEHIKLRYPLGYLLRRYRNLLSYDAFTNPVGMAKTPECHGDLGTCPCTAGRGGPWPEGGGGGVLCANLGDFGVLFGATRTENGEPPLNFLFSDAPLGTCG